MSDRMVLLWLGIKLVIDVVVFIYLTMRYVR